MEVETEGYNCMGKMLFGLHGLMAVCEKDQTVLQYIWDKKEMMGKVPFAIDQKIETPKEE